MSVYSVVRRAVNQLFGVPDVPGGARSVRYMERRQVPACNCLLGLVVASDRPPTNAEPESNLCPLIRPSQFKSQPMARQISLCITSLGVLRIGQKADNFND